VLLVLAGCTAPSGTPAVPTSPVPASTKATPGPPQLRLETFPVPDGAAPHDVAPAADGGVWFTAQHAGYLGHLTPATGRVRQVPLGPGSAPHGVVVDRGGAPWVTDGGLNAIVRVDPTTYAVTRYPLPATRPNANLNTATFDRRGVLWFTGQSGVYGRLEPATGQMEVFDAPGGRGPYGITTTPNGDVYYASLAGSHIARIDTSTGAATVLQPPTRGQGARRVWSDSLGRIWLTEWNAGRLGRYDPPTAEWKEWQLPGARPQPYAVYVDGLDQVWLSDFGANALLRFDPARESFTTFALPGGRADVRQILGRFGEVWGAASAQDRLVVIRQ
jgi:virginiamycin B lyase